MTLSSSRRLVLKSAAASLALPFFESLVPRPLRAQPAAVPLRLLIYFTPNGFWMNDWVPQGTGSAYTLGPSCQGLVPFKNKLTFVRGLDRAVSIGTGADHAAAAAAFLTGARPRKQLPITAGTSIDQLIVQKSKPTTRFPSLHFGSGREEVGVCDAHPCSYMSTISWKSSNEPIPVLRHPKAAFDLIFTGHDPNASKQDVERRRALKASVLDFAVDDVRTVSAQLATSDRHKLDEYLEGVRALETLVTASAPASTGAACGPGGLDVRVSDTDFHAHVKLHTKIAALALRCDLTRVMVFMYANVQSGRSYANIGVSGGHHDLSHHGNNAGKVEGIKKIDRYMMNAFAEMLAELDRADEAGQSVLDRSLVFMGGELADGNRHQHVNLPVILAGSAGGKVKTGTVVNMPSGTPVANLFVTLAQLMGVTIDSFADSRGPLKDVLV